MPDLAYNPDPDSWHKPKGSVQWVDDQGRPVPTSAVRAQLHDDLADYASGAKSIFD